MRVLKKVERVKQSKTLFGNVEFESFEFEPEAVLLWTPWREGEWERPVWPSATAQYHPISIHGKLVDQPRRTVCYDHAYTYSGQQHPVEKETPPAITALYGHVESLFGVKTNMCLANGYLHGYHCIGAHSDNERQMGALTDVFCFVVGATRQAVFRNKGKFNDVLLDIMLPEGLYVMRGAAFQKKYTHEFPRMKSSVWKSLADGSAVGTTMQKADWVCENQELIREKLTKGRAQKRLKLDSEAAPASSPLVAEFNQWVQPRYSYTLRQFTH